METKKWEKVYILGEFRVMVHGGRTLARFGPSLEDEDNARLFVSAPDLLEACKAMVSCLDNLTSTDFTVGGDRPCRLKLEAAIAKATS